jgi:hypothetical protein
LLSLDEMHGGLSLVEQWTELMGTAARDISTNLTEDPIASNLGELTEMEYR